MPAHIVTEQEALTHLSSLKTVWSPKVSGMGVSLRPATAAGALCRPAQIRDLIKGDFKARALAPVLVPEPYGDDVRKDRRLGARREWITNAEFQYRVAPRSGAPAMRFWTSERKLSEKEQHLQWNLELVDRALRDLPPGLTGHELKKKKNRLQSKLVVTALNRADHVTFAAEVQRTSRRKLRVYKPGREFDPSWSRRPDAFL
jgi:hypothetical protein